jgi:hypothetical protein
MLGLRQSLVTTGKVGGGTATVLEDIGGLGTGQEGGGILIHEAPIPNTNKVSAYAVIPRLVPIFYSDGTIPKYVGTWEECRDFAHTVILSSQVGETNAKFVGANQYNAGTEYTIQSPDPRFSIYTHLDGSNITTIYQTEIEGGVPIQESLQYEHTYLIRLWWEEYYIGEQYELTYAGSRFIWGARETSTSNYAYALDLITGEQVLRPVTEKNSFLLFRRFTYNSLTETEPPEQFLQATLSGAPAPTGYALNRSPQLAQSISENYQNSILFPTATVSKTFEFEVKFNAIQQDVAGQNSKADLYIHPPFDKVKKVTFPNGQTRIDIASNPEMTIKGDLLYFYTNSAGTKVPQFIYNVEASVAQYSNLSYPKVNVYSVSTFNAYPKIEYIYTYKIDMSQFPGFEPSATADIIGPISLYNVRFKFTNYTESIPKNYGIYGMKNVPIAPNIDWPAGSGASRNVYVINKNFTDFYTAWTSNPSLVARFLAIFNGTDL